MDIMYRVLDEEMRTFIGVRLLCFGLACRCVWMAVDLFVAFSFTSLFWVCTQYIYLVAVAFADCNFVHTKYRSFHRILECRKVRSLPT